jgi:hypothetical protein
MGLKKKYTARQPTSAIYSMSNRSDEIYVDILHQQEEYGFKYAGEIVSLKLFINGYSKLNFAVQKLVRLMSLPGEQHIKLLRNQGILQS